MVQPSFTPQTHYIHPDVTGDKVRYFEWMGAAHYVADRRAGAMHGKVFLCDSLFAGIDDSNVYGRLDFVDSVPENDFEIVVNLESWADQSSRPRRALRLNAKIENQTPRFWNVSESELLRSRECNRNSRRSCCGPGSQLRI